MRLTTPAPAAVVLALCLSMIAGACAGSDRDSSLDTAPVATATGEASTTAPPGAAAPPPPPPAPSTTAPPPTTTTAPPTDGIAAYRGLGTWVDVYDWSHYKGSSPVVGPDAVDAMAAAGVQTLYIQTSRSDIGEDVLEPDLLLPILERAEALGLRVVAWYLPTLTDPETDFRRLRVSSALPGVDALGVDIEARDVADVGERNRRLIELSRRLRAALPDTTLGAIVMPPVQLEVVNTSYWPAFPWREIAPFYDVWLTMGYWTFRRGDHRDAWRYTEENIRRLRANLGQPAAQVHPIGGIGDRTTPADLDGFARAIADQGAIGGSIYDWRTTGSEAWPALRALRR